jgi:hypothetical protein
MFVRVKYLLTICFILAGLLGLAQDTLPTPVQIPPPQEAPRPVTPRPRPQVRRTGPSPAAIRRADSLRRDSLQRDSLRRADSLATVKPQRFLPDSLLYGNHPFFRFTDPIRFPVVRRQWQGKEGVFYSIIGLLLFFAFIRNGFSRYIGDLVSTYFRTTMRQRHIKDQLAQSPLPSLMLNIFFILCSSLFLTMLLRYFNLGANLPFWLLYVYCIVGLVLIYCIKFLSLKFFGWIFQVREATDAYIFIVFTTNKIIGIALLPFIVVLAFTSGTVYQAAFTLSMVLIAGLFCYRYFLSYASIHRQIRINFFHFLLYMVAFEIAPLLLINKLLFRFLMETS